MTGKPTVTLTDPEKVVIDLLIAAGQPAGTVKTEFPSNTLTGTNTRVQVELESSNVVRYPIQERAQVRVVAYAAPGKRDAVKTLAATLLADLYAFPGSASVAGIVPLSGRSAVTVDPTTRNLMCWVLVRVDLTASVAS
jgi:hypothetical protein